jgi:hypothetical protein
MEKTVVVILASLLTACAAYAQMQPGQPGQPGQPPQGGMAPGMAPNMGAMGSPGMPRYGGDPLTESFFPPELIMQNQRAIGLSAEQQAAMRAELQKVTAKLTDLQWQQSAETEAMLQLVNQGKPDEKQVLAQFGKVLAVDNEVRSLNLGMLIRLKNMLSPDQQARLRALKAPAMMMGFPPGAGGPQGPGMWPPGGEDPRAQGQGRPPAGPGQPPSPGGQAR